MRKSVMRRAEAAVKGALRILGGSPRGSKKAKLLYLGAIESLHSVVYGIHRDAARYVLIRHIADDNPGPDARRGQLNARRDLEAAEALVRVLNRLQRRSSKLYQRERRRRQLRRMIPNPTGRARK